MEIEFECPTCLRDRIDVAIALREARDCHNEVYERHLLNQCAACRTFFKREQKQEVKS